MLLYILSFCLPGSAVSKGADQMVYTEVTQSRKIQEEKFWRAFLVPELFL